MAQPFPTYLRTNRRKWALSQRELADLVGGVSAGAISKYETLARPPSAELLLACEFIFDQPAHALFPAMALGVVRAVLRNAQILRAELADKHDAESVRKRRLLDDVVIRSKKILGV